MKTSFYCMFISRGKKLFAEKVSCHSIFKTNPHYWLLSQVKKASDGCVKSEHCSLTKFKVKGVDSNKVKDRVFFNVKLL